VSARPAYVGRRITRREDRRLLLGGGRYLDDIDLPGQAHLAVVRSSLAHGRITGIDTRAAAGAPGVLAVLTGDDIRDEVGPLPCIDLYPQSHAALHRVLAVDKVRYVGEPLAVVVAEDPYLAEDAAELVDVTLEPLPAVVDLTDAVAEDSTLLYEEFGTNIANTIEHDVGDVDAAFAAADHVFRETFEIHRYGPVPLECRGALAHVETGTGRITLYSSTQFPHLARQFLGGVLGIPESHIRVIAPDVGGGFGAKCEFYSEEVLVPLMAMRLGRPVKWVEDRREHLVSTTQAREQRHEVAAAVSADGTIEAITVESSTSNGSAMFTLATTPASIFSGMLRGPYRIPNYRARSHSVLTNKTPLAVYRGAGHPQAAFCMERMVDIIAADLGMDRADLRRRNMLTTEELPSDRGTEIVLAGKVVYDTGDYPRCLDMALDMLDYADFAEEQRVAREQGRYLGLGMCSYVEETSTGPYESATVRVDGTGKVTVLSGAVPQGQGHVTTFAQLVADELEVDLEDVTVLQGDTDVIPDGVGTFASRSAAIGGAAARKGAEEVKRKAMIVAAHLLEVDLDDLEWEAAGAQVIGSPSTRAELGELAQAATAWNSLPEGLDGFNLDSTYRHQAAGIAFANATHVAKVEVDPETGRVTILRYGVVHDCGTVINPLLVDGQVHGGVAQGIGGTLLEEFAYDEDGQPLATTFLDYLLPLAEDIPHIETGHLESPTYLNLYGMKGAGEGGAVGSPGAIVNAIADALAPFGVHLTSDGPYSPGRIHELLRAATSTAP
jgi:carbon-monoxide dehydrogenase large subunit